MIKLSFCKAKEKCGGVAYLVATVIQSFPFQGISGSVEALMNTRDLTPQALLYVHKVYGSAGYDNL